MNLSEAKAIISSLTDQQREAAAVVVENAEIHTDYTADGVGEDSAGFTLESLADSIRLMRPED